MNWNTGRLLRGCLASVARETAGVAHEVIVVDNASEDGSAALVRAEFPAARLIEAGANRGFAGGNNLALREVRGEYVALLNPDTLVEDRALERLVDFLAAHPAAGAVGPAVVQPDARYAVENCGWQPTLGTVLAHYAGLSRLWPGRVRGLNLVVARRQRVGWLSGACLMLRRAVIDEVGPLDEGTFMYAEDLEWCDRIAARGWELWYEPAARVLHFDRQGTGQRGERFSTLWVHALRRHYRCRTGATRGRAALFDAILAGGLLSRAVVYGVRARRRPRERHWRAEARSFARAAGEIARDRAAVAGAGSSE